MKTYYTQNSKYGYYDNDGNFAPCGKEIVVVKKLESIEAIETRFELQFDSGGNTKTIQSSFVSLQSDLENAGYGVDDKFRRHLVPYIQQQLNNLPCIYFFKELGWCEHQGKQCFKAYQLKSGTVQAEYNGIYTIKPHSDTSGFIAGIKSTILANNKLVLAMVIGLSACVVGFLKNNAVNVDSIIYNIFGRSTTGKTTAAKLATSMGGSVFTNSSDKRSLFGNCSATANAIEERLNGNYGYPTVLDEIGRLKKDIDVTQLIYDIAEGTNKDRLDSNSKLKKPKIWATGVILTGEFSILSKVNKTDGVGLRVLTFEFPNWTQSADEAHSVEIFITKFSGIGIDMLADEMLLHKPDVIVRAFWRIVKIAKQKLSISPDYRERVGKNVAVMLLTAILAQRTFGIKLNTKLLENLILQSIAGSQQRPTWEAAYEHFCAFVKRNQTRFTFKIVNNRGNAEWSNSGSNVPVYKDVGFIQYKQGNSEFDHVFITTTEFDAWFEAEELPDKNPILQEWERNGLIIFKEASHKEMIRNISPEKNSKRRGYKIYFKDIFVEDDDPDESKDEPSANKIDLNDVLNDDDE